MNLSSQTPWRYGAMLAAMLAAAALWPNAAWATHQQRDLRHAGVLLYASFDNGARPDFWQGVEPISNGEAAGQIAPGATRNGYRTANLTYRAAGNLDPARGTVACFARIIPGQGPLLRVLTLHGGYRGAMLQLDVQDHWLRPWVLTDQGVARGRDAMPATDFLSGWHHLAITWDQRFGTRCYVDSKQISEDWGDRGWREALVPYSMELHAPGGIDELFVLDRALDGDQIDALRQGQLSTPADVDVLRCGALPAGETPDALTSPVLDSDAGESSTWWIGGVIAPDAAQPAGTAALSLASRSGWMCHELTSTSSRRIDSNPITLGALQTVTLATEPARQTMVVRRLALDPAIAQAADHEVLHVIVREPACPAVPAAQAWFRVPRDNNARSVMELRLDGVAVEAGQRLWVQVTSLHGKWTTNPGRWSVRLVADAGNASDAAMRLWRRVSPMLKGIDPLTPWLGDEGGPIALGMEQLPAAAADPMLAAAARLDPTSSAASLAWRYRKGLALAQSASALDEGVAPKWAAALRHVTRLLGDMQVDPHQWLGTPETHDASHADRLLASLTAMREVAQQQESGRGEWPGATTLRRAMIWAWRSGDAQARAMLERITTQRPAMAEALAARLSDPRTEVERQLARPRAQMRLNVTLEQAIVTTLDQTGDRKYLAAGLAAARDALQAGQGVLWGIGATAPTPASALPGLVLCRRAMTGAMAAKTAGLSWPAVSWDELPNDVVAVVNHDDAASAHISLFNFTDKPRPVKLRPWRLDRGDYQLLVAPDANGDDSPDLIPPPRLLRDLTPGSAVDMLVPAGGAVVQLTQHSRSPIAASPKAWIIVQPDPATDPNEDAACFQVINLGAAEAIEVTVQLNWNGEVRRQWTLPRLPGAGRHQPTIRRLCYPNVAALGPGTVTVSVVRATGLGDDDVYDPTPAVLRP
ncbi:MAG: hypothetical protein IT440_05180 [Phycisphaeraceae bacterium]|nr:hypothetical protein [Phycisphaeraceae bacterium]